ncbi:MAG: hypothetical protein ABGY05_13015 [Pseudomonadota bacterium]
MTDQNQEALIECQCGKCALTIADKAATLFLRCGCVDCRQALWWGHAHGGAKPEPLPRLFYLRSDIVDIAGKSYMKAYKLRSTGESTRIYCSQCYSVLGVDHPTYQNNVFLNFPDHCTNHGDLSRALSAYLNMSGYSAAIGPLPTEDVPLFVSTDSAPERQRFLSLSDVAHSFKEPSGPPSGVTLASLIESLGAVTILNLAKGDMG